MFQLYISCIWNVSSSYCFGIACAAAIVEHQKQSAYCYEEKVYEHRDAKSKKVGSLFSLVYEFAYYAVFDEFGDEWDGQCFVGYKSMIRWRC